jgi:uncharacterized membrane protein YgcG
VLASNTDTINSALGRLYDKTGVRLYVLFVNTTCGTNIADYAVQAGKSSTLGSRDAVLVVALSDHSDNISLRQDLIDAVSQAGLDDVRTKTLEPGLVSGDYGGAVVRTADALGNVFPPPPTAGPATLPVPSADSPSGAQTGSGGGASLGLVLVLIVIGVGVLALVGRAARRRARPT